MAEARWSIPVVGLALLAGCGERAPDTPPAEPAAAPPVVEITTTDYAYQAPDTLPAGMVTLRLKNDGPELHHVTMVRLEQGKTPDDLFQALASEAVPPWAVLVGGPNTPVPGGVSEATLELAAGNYVIVCLIPSPDGVLHVAKGMVKPVTVVASGAPVAAPEADVVMRLTDYDFTMSKPLTAGRHLIRVEVDSTQPHEVLLVRLVPGKTVAEVAAWAEKPVGPPPGEPIGGTTPIGPGGVNYVPVDLTPGEYGLICFMPDARDGKPHLVHGMIKQITVM